MLNKLFYPYSPIWNRGSVYGTGAPRGSSSMVYVYAVSVKMKTTKKMMIAALLTIAVLTVGITPIFAAPDTAMHKPGD